MLASPVQTAAEAIARFTEEIEAELGSDKHAFTAQRPSSKLYHPVKEQELTFSSAKSHTGSGNRKSHPEGSIRIVVPA